MKRLNQVLLSFLFYCVELWKGQPFCFCFHIGILLMMHARSLEQTRMLEKQHSHVYMRGGKGRGGGGGDCIRFIIINDDK